MFGPVVTLQNVAVISSMQKTPVVGAAVGVDWTAGPPNCCSLDNVASCAAVGDATKSSAQINASFFISTRLSQLTAFGESRYWGKRGRGRPGATDAQ
jgi:hypothetical protein